MKNKLHNIEFSIYDSHRSVLHAGKTIHFLIENEKRRMLEEQMVDMNEAELDELYSLIVNQASTTESPQGLQDFQCKFTLLSGEYVSKIAQLFSFMFKPAMLLITFSLSLCYCIYELLYVTPPFVKGYFNPDCWWLSIMFMCLFHEIGHAAACKNYKVPIGDIGVGIAGFCPVMFTDVSGAWYLKKTHRLVVNIGGVYFQSIFVAIMTGIAMYLNSVSLFYVCKTMIFTVFIQFYPFFRMDGYWMLSDLLCEPNLYYDAIETVKSKFHNYAKPLSRRQWKLLIYHVTFEILVLIFLLSFIFNNIDLIVNLPRDCYLFVCNIINGTENYSMMFSYKIFMTLTIFMLFIHTIYKKIRVSLLKGQQ